MNDSHKVIWFFSAKIDTTITFKMFFNLLPSILDVYMHFLGLHFTLIWNNRRLRKVSLHKWSQILYVGVIFGLQGFSSTNLFLCGCSDHVSHMSNCWYLKLNFWCLSAWIITLIQRCNDEWQFLALWLNLHSCSIFM